MPSGAKTLWDYPGDAKLMTNTEINELIEKVDSAFEKTGGLGPERAQLMWISLAELVRAQMNSQLSALLDLAKGHSRRGGKDGELSAARAFLDSEDLKRIAAGRRYEKAAFIQN